MAATAALLSGERNSFPAAVPAAAMVAAVEPTVRAKVREQLRLALNPERLHFFDGRSDAAI